MHGTRYDLEMSVDETETPTSIYEHYFMAHELLRRKLPVVSLAPRFVGKFQKGVDYIGDTAPFEAELIKHAAILKHFDAYKLSVHTGSDKFSIYPLVAKYAEDRVHVKTAGTSYLEALRVIADLDTALFRQILDYSRARFETDRKTYFLDCQPDKVPANADLSDADLPGLLRAVRRPPAAARDIRLQSGPLRRADSRPDRRPRGSLRKGAEHPLHPPSDALCQRRCGSRPVSSIDQGETNGSHTGKAIPARAG